MIDIYKYKTYGFVLSILLVVGSICFIFFYGFRYSIEFVGGTTVQYNLNTAFTESDVRTVLQEMEIEPSELQIEDTVLEFTSRQLDETEEASLQANLQESTGEELEVLRSATVGPSVSQDLVVKTLIALSIGVLIIFSYITYAFKDFRFALAAITALIHDIIILLGVYSVMSTFFGAELDTLLVTAILTTLSLSVHDTIVMFDKVREHKKISIKAGIEYVANKAITETLVRSINSSMTTVFMLLSLVLLGGDSIRFFALALLTGILVGTYSSPFIAVPILVILEKRKKIRNSES